MVPCLASVIVFAEQWEATTDWLTGWLAGAVCVVVLHRLNTNSQSTETKSQSGVIVFPTTPLKIPETQWDRLFLLFIVNKELSSYQFALCGEFLPFTRFGGDSRSSNAALCPLSHTHPWPLRSAGQVKSLPCINWSFLAADNSGTACWFIHSSCNSFKLSMKSKCMWIHPDNTDCRWFLLHV